ncbi:MAG: hypothetical protein WBA14_04430, partial [Pseudolabrys sp.]
MSILLALAASCGLCAESYSATAQKVPLPRPRPPLNTAKPATLTAATTGQTQASAPLPQTRPAANGAGMSSYAQANV